MDLVQFLTIEISRIIPDPDQPRRFFDEAALQELTESVKVNGVIQPIMLRPNGDEGYMVVCGERRYRASIAAGLTEIPAVVRELTNEQALELQIIENLQRKDVHPMEEAVAFQSLLDHKQFTVLEIASRVGKSDFYVRQRLKLNELTTAWQQVFFKNIINLRDALLVCPLPEKSQEAVYTAYEHKFALPGAKVHLDTWTMDKYKGDLSDASFDLNDSSLYPGAGACSNCQYNTSVSLLFPEHAKTPRCLNTVCFKMKSELHLDRELKEAQEDPTVVLVNHAWHGDNELVKRLISEGVTVLRINDDYYEVESPEAPDFDSLKEEYEYELEEGEKTIEEIEEEFKELQASHAAEIDRYNKKVSSGKYARGFIIHGSSDEVGKYIYVDLKDRAANKSKVENSSLPDPESDGIKSEMERIKKREERNCELDAIKVHAGILEQLKDNKDLKIPSLLHQSIDRGLMIYLLLESGGYSFRDEIRKKLKSFPKKPEARNQYHAAYFQDLAKTTDDQLAFIVRRLAHEKYGSRNLQYGITTDDTTMFIIAGYLGIDIKALEDAQAAKAEKRKAKVNLRLTELKKQLKPAPEKSDKKAKANSTKEPTATKVSKKKSDIAKGISSLINKEKE